MDRERHWWSELSLVLISYIEVEMEFIFEIFTPNPGLPLRLSGKVYHGERNSGRSRCDSSNHAAWSDGASWSICFPTKAMMEDVVESASSAQVSRVVENATMAETRSNTNRPSAEFTATTAKLLPRHYYQCEFPDLVDLISMFPVPQVSERSSLIIRPHADATHGDQRALSR